MFSQIQRQMMKSVQILSSKHYPYTHKAFKSYKVQKPYAYTMYRNMFVLGLGSNLAPKSKDSVEILESVFVWLDSHSQIRIIQSSPIWRNPPFGFALQNDFYNAVLVCESSLSLVEIFRLMFYVERRFGRRRKRAFKNAPRTLDVDLILFNALRLKWEHLYVPHRFYMQRSSVMLPMSFIKNLASLS